MNNMISFFNGGYKGVTLNLCDPEGGAKDP